MISSHKEIKDSFYKNGFEICYGFSFTEELASKFFSKNIEGNHHLIRTGFFIGNTKNLWPFFVKEFSCSQLLQSDSDPFDTFVEQTVKSISTKHKLSKKIIFAHQPSFSDIDENSFFPFQRFAEHIELAKIGANHLSFHPTYGYWFSMRALVFSDEALPLVNTQYNWQTDPCTRKCSDYCGKAENTNNEKDWEAELARRSSCPFASEFRFSKDQSEYHYTHNKSMLMKLKGVSL
jgi:hypothetical protein